MTVGRKNREDVCGKKMKKREQQREVKSEEKEGWKNMEVGR